MNNTKERRRYIRMEDPVPVTVRFKTENSIEQIQTNSKNISATGMMIEIEKGIPLETTVEISLAPKKTLNPIHINAKVVRSEKDKGESLYNTGLEFTKIEEDNKNTFLKFLCDTIYKI
ncbi:MAG: PilZ domain-containing protein [Candidatus Omnitrophota bacterium]